MLEKQERLKETMKMMGLGNAGQFIQAMSNL